MALTYEQVKEKVSKYGQEQVLKYVNELTDAEKEVLFAQIEATDMDVIECCKHKEDMVKRGVISPLGAMELSEIEANKESFTKTGIEAIKAGKVGALLLAGGMGTRLGSDNPKGMYNVGITRELYI
nr:UTP--glucose-1-phosphate uridylyltransferase [Acetatifactor sp.]